jgi:membrane dipeptidase
MNSLDTHSILERYSIIFLAMLLIGTTLSASESITLNGLIKDKNGNSPIDSAVVAIINKNNPNERYSVASNSSGVWTYTFEVTSAPRNKLIPEGFEVQQNYPNPFNPSTHIQFVTPNAGTVRISIYNSIGQLLTEKQYFLTAGSHSIEWNSNGAAGVLFYTIEFSGVRITKKMVQLDGGYHGGLGTPVTYGGVSRVSSLSKIQLNEYYVIASKLIYMPDTVTVTVSSNLQVDFLLETVHSKAFVIDLHNDVMEKAVLGGYELGVRHTINQSDLPRFKEGGYDAQMFAVWTDYTDSVAYPFYSFTLAMMDSFTAQINRNSAVFARARNADEILQANAAGKFAGILAVEGGHAIQNDLEKLKTYYQRGARYLTITWNNSIAWAVSAQDSRSTTVGLSEFGKQVVRTMDSLGMIVDIAHTGIKTINDVLATTKNPIIDTHCGVRALNNHYRNLYDYQIDSIAARGGVIGVVFHKSFLMGSGTFTISEVIKHIDYIKKRVGIDFVALGSDFDGGITTPVELEDVSKLPKLTEALLKNGYTIAEVRKILGENYLRVFRQVCH